MIEGGRVGALFFIVCFFSWRCTNQAFFLYLWKVKMADEWKDAVGKERTKGVRVHRGVLTRAGEFLPFFLLALFFVVVDFAFLLSSSSKKKKSTTTWHVTRKEQNPLGRGDIFFPESGVWLAQKREFFLFFSIFFSRSTQRDLSIYEKGVTHSFFVKN